MIVEASLLRVGQTCASEHHLFASGAGCPEGVSPAVAILDLGSHILGIRGTL